MAEGRSKVEINLFETLPMPYIRHGTPHILVNQCEPLVRDVLFPRTRGGDLKHRLSFNEKLHLLDPDTESEITQERLMAFMNVFAFRTTGGIITKASGGPRDWAALRGSIAAEQVARHLLADSLLPVFRPQWIGSRSPSTTRLMALDVDGDRPDDPILNLDGGLKHIHAYGYRDLEEFIRNRAVARERARAKIPFADRCHSAEEFFRRLGADPEDPRQVLRQATPSGGRHYYSVLDRPYFLSQIHNLFLEAGLRHLPGQIEFFPSMSRALRLPFGHVPGQVHDPQAWIKFIDDLVNHRVRRFSLEEMYENLTTNPGRKAKPVRQAAPRDLGSSRANVAKPASLGLPRGRRDELRSSRPDQSNVDYYLRLVNAGCSSTDEAQDLIEMGIRVEGTRTLALKQLAAHLIWFLGYSADQAAEALATWALDDRHRSKDIQADLAAGTSKVKTQVVGMCRWYAKEKGTNASTEWSKGNPSACFAPEELAILIPSIQSLPVEDRSDQASFFLSFLTFAKRHGRPRDDGSGWEAAPAVNTFIRKWDGCRGRSRYLTRMNTANAAGLLVMIREKLQVPGGKGRARTYLLSVPVVDQTRWTMSRAEALARLIGTSPQEQAAMQEPAKHQDEPRRLENERPIKLTQYPEQHPYQGTDQGPVHPGRPGGSLGSRPPCGPRESAPVETVPHRGYEAISALPASDSPDPALSTSRDNALMKSAPSSVLEIRRSGGPAIADDPFIIQVLAGRVLSPRMEGILNKPTTRLTPRDQSLVRDLLETHVRSMGGASDPESIKLKQRITSYARRFQGVAIANWIPHPP